MKKLLGAVLFVLLVVSQGCGTCKLEREAIDQIEESQTAIFSRYMEYVRKDPALSDKAKDTEQKLVDQVKGTVIRLRKRTE